MEVQVQLLTENRSNGQLPRWDYEQFLDRAKEATLKINPRFEFDTTILRVYEIMALYFTNSPKFETEGHGSLYKGLYLCGNTGTGKSTILKACRENPKRSYRVVTSNNIVNEYMSGGVDQLDQYFGIPQVGQISRSSIGIDDIGTEPQDVKYMGCQLNVIEQIILNRYSNEMPFYQTHITSNLDGNELERMYGVRVRSRIREMFNFIVVPGNDKRK